MRFYKLLIITIIAILAASTIANSQTMRLRLQLRSVYFDRGDDPFSNKPDPRWKIRAQVPLLGIDVEPCIEINNTNQGTKTRTDVIFDFTGTPVWLLNGITPLVINIDGWEEDRGSSCSYNCCAAFQNDDDARNRSSGSVIIGLAVQEPGDTYNFSVGSRYRADFTLSLETLDVFDGTISTSATVEGPDQDIFCGAETVVLDANVNSNYFEYFLEWQEETSPNNWETVGLFNNRDYIQVPAVSPFPNYRVRNLSFMDEFGNDWRELDGSGVTVSASPPNVAQMEINTPLYCDGAGGSIEITDLGSSVNGSTIYTFTLLRNGNTLPSGGNQSGSAGDLPIVFGDLQDGNYDLIVVEQGANARCADTLNNINLSPAPLPEVVSFTPTNARCKGESNGRVSIQMSNATGLNFFELQQNGVVIYDAISNTSSVTRNGVAAGTYDIVVRNGNGCENIVIPQVTVGEPDELTVLTTLNPTGSSFDVACRGEGIEVILNVSGGNGSLYTVSGDDGFIRRSLSPITVTVPANGGTNTTLTVSDERGCSTSVDLGSITEPATNISITEIGTTGTGACAADGTADFSASGGVPNYTFYVDNDLSTSNTTGSFTMLSGGSHTIYVLDDNGCIATQSFTIAESSSLTLSVTDPVRTSCFGFADGGFTLEASGGTPPYFYSVDGGATFTAATAAGVPVVYDDLTGGPKDILVRDSEPVTACEIGRIVTVLQPAELFIENITFTPMACSDELIDLYVVFSSTNAVFTLMDGPEISLDGGTSFVAADVNILGEQPDFFIRDVAFGDEGSFDIVIRNGDGCETTNSFPLSVDNPEAMSIPSTPTSTDEICFGNDDGTITASVSGGRPPYVFSLFNNGLIVRSEPISPVNGIASFTFTNLPPEAAVTGDGNTGYAVGITDASVDAGAAGSCSVVYPPSFDTLSFTLGSASETMIGIIPAPELQIVTMTNVGPDLNCVNGIGDNGEVEITTVTGGYPPYEYSSDNVVFQSDNTLTGLSVNPRVYVRDANGCVVEDRFFGLSQRPDITTSLTLLESATTCTKGSIEVTLNNGVGPYEIQVFTTPSGLGCEGEQLFFSDGTPYSVFQTSETTFTIDELEGDTYELAIYDLGTDCSYCSNGSIVVPLENELMATVTNKTTESCSPGSDGTLTIAITGGVAPYTTDINFANPQTGSNPTFTGLTAYTPYAFRVTDAVGCQVIFADSVDLVTILDLDATVTDITTCAGDENGSITATPINGTPPYTVTWNIDQIPETIGAGGTTSRTGLGAGEYEILVEDAAGCLNEIAVYLLEPDSIVEDVVFIEDASCLGVPDGSISLSVLGGSGTLSYRINGSTPQSTGDFTGLDAGDYTITVEDTNGCTFDFMYTVGAGSSISATASVSDATCGGFADGSISMTPSGGVAPYEYALDGTTFSTDNPITGLTAGTYEVTVRDANGCTFVLSDIVVGEASALMVTVNVVQDATCTEAFGTLEAVVTGGTEPYSYVWDGDPALNQNTLTNAASGDHTVEVTDANGCTTTAMGTISTIPAVFINLVSSTDEICDQMDGSITVEGTDGTPPYTFAWSNGNDTESDTGLATGTYTITVTDANGCTDDIEVILDNIASPTPVLTITNSFCTDDNGSISVAVTDGTAPFTYSLDGGTPQNDPLFAGLSAGTYTITVEDANGCTGTADGTIEFIPLPTLNLIVTDAACDLDDGEILVGVVSDNGPFTYLWDDGETTSSRTNLAPGSYTVTVTDANGCEASETATIGEIAAPTVTVESTTDATCGESNGATTVSVTGGTEPYTYNWSVPNPSTPSVSNLPQGFSSVVVTDARGCETTAFVNIGGTGGPTDVNLFVNPSFCEDGNGSIEATVTGGTEPYTYEWSNGDTGQTITDLFSGSYTVTVTDANGCTITGTELVPLVEGPTLEAPVVTNSLCEDGNGAISINVLIGTGPFTYTWDNGIGVAGATVTDLTVGTYTVTVTDVDGCSSTASASVLLEPAPILTIAQAQNENCDQADGLIEVSVLANTGTAPFSYSWSHDAGLDSPIASGLSADTYTVTITDANGCTDEISQTLTNEAGIILTEGTVEPDLCGQGVGSATVEISGGTAPFTFAWDGLPGQTTATATGLFAGTYTVTVTDANGCFASLDITVGEIAGPSISFDSSTEDPCVADDVMAVVVTTNGTAPYTYSWSHQPDLDSPVATGLTTDTYTVTVTDVNGCSDMISFDLTDNSSPELSIADFTNSNCTNGTGSITVAATGGAAPLTISWDHDDTVTEFSLTDLEAGTYTATVTDANGCTAMISQEILFVAGPEIVLIELMDPECGQDNGFIDVDVSGGTAPYTIVWDHNGGESTLQIGLAAGDYTINVTDANGCMVSETYTLTAPPDIEGTVSNVTDEICAQANGSITVDITTAAALTYSWSHDAGLNAPTATGLSADDYSVTISADGFCDLVLNATVNEIEGPSLSDPTVVDSDCNASNGSVSFVASGGTAPYTYSWSHQMDLDSPEATGLPAGSYTITVTDSNGCTAEASATVSDRDAPQIEATLTNPSCENDNGSISVTVTGGVESYTYSWSHDMSVTGPEATGLSAGDYTLTVTDVNGCTAVSNFTLTIDDPLIINILDQQNSLCTDGNGLISLETTGGTAPYDYSWSHDNTATGPSQSNLNAGDYTIVVTDQSGCTAELMITLTLEGSPSLTVISTEDAVCDEMGSITVQAAGGAEPYMYSWSHDAGLNSPTASDLAVGDYTVTVTDANGCTASETISLGGTANPVLVANTVDPVCAEDSGSIEIIASAGTEPYTYSWSHDDTATSNTLMGLTAGEYTVTVSDADGCSSTLTTTLSYSGGPVATITNQENSLCSDDNGSIEVEVNDGIPPYTYSWSHDGSLNAPIASGLSAGTYSLTVTDSNGCFSSITTEITFTAGPSLSWAEVIDASCAEDNGSLTVAVSDGTEPYSYDWSHDGTLNDATASSLAPGDYSVTVTDANGCMAVLSNTVSAADLFILFPVQTQPTCNGLSDGGIMAEVEGGIAPYTFVWSTGTTGETIDGLPAGTYSVTATDSQGCQASASLEIENLDDLILNFNTTGPGCNGEEDATAEVIVSNGSGDYTYSWDAPGNPETAMISGLAAGDYTVTVTDVTGCIAEATVNIADTPELSLASTSSASCLNLLNGTATVTPQSGSDPYTYLWDDGDGQTTATAMDLAPGIYNVTVTDADGCSGTTSVLVDAAAAVEIEISELIQPDCIANPAGSATVNVTAGSGDYTYAWDDPLGQSTPTASGLDPGTYTVTVTDLNGCFATTSVTIEAAGELAILTTSVVIPTCNGESDASATVQVANGSGNYTYQWDDPNGQTNQVLMNVPAGTYTVTITDTEDGCFITEVVDINEPDVISVTLDEVNGPSCSNDDDGNAFISAEGGSGVYTYQWDDPAAQTTTFIDNLMPGDYTVTVTDENDCTGTLTITVPEGGDLEAAIDDFTAPTCFGIADGTATVDVTGNPGNLTYQWDDPAFQQTQVATGLNPGTYNVTVTDDTGCEAFATVEIPTTPELIVSLVNSTSPSCSGFADGQLEISITGGTGATSIVWDDPMGQSTALVTGLESGDYTVMVTDDNGCVTTETYTLDDAVALSFNDAVIVNPSCFNTSDGSATVEVMGGTGPYTYEWDDDTMQTGNTAVDLAPGTYNVLATDANGCSLSQIVELASEAAEIVLTEDIQEPSCDGGADGAISVAASGGAGGLTYAWSNGSSDTSIGDLLAGSYGLTITDTDGCTQEAAYELAEGAPFVIDLGDADTTICAGEVLFYDFT
ncbi:MAG: hypothetical protein AAFR36_23535, partial [Bacteroidota bacterium]